MPQEDDGSKIVVGVDGSEAARAAALAAIQLADSLRWSLRAVYVIDEVLVMDAYANLHHELGREDEPRSREERMRWLQAQGEGALAWVVEQAAAHGVLVESEIIFGGMPDALLQEAEHAALLAVGRRGNGHAGRSDYLGHHLRTMARRSPRPLLVGGEAPASLQHLLLAYDGEQDTEQALAWAAAWQQQLPLAVTVLVVDDGAPAGWIAGLKTRVARSHLHPASFLVERGNPAERIVAALEASHADAVMLGSYDHSGLVEWFTGSTLDQVLRHSVAPAFVSCGQLPSPPAPGSPAGVTEGASS